MNSGREFPRRALLVQPWTPGPYTWRSMTRYAERLAEMLRPGTEVSSARASHLNVVRPLRRFHPKYRSFDALSADGHEVDLVHFTDVYLGVHAKLFPQPRVTTLHDTIPFAYTRWLGRGGLRARGAFLRSIRALPHSDLVITPSGHTRREILAARDLDPERVRAVPVLVPGKFTPGTGGRAPATILSVGTSSEYKNLPVLLHALARPELRGSRLVRVGSRLDARLAALARELGIEDRIEDLGGVSDERLIELLRTATVLAQPSRDEGFGMPVAEAMACGLPVVASDGGALPEVVGVAGVVVPFRKHGPGPPDLDDARDFARALQSVLEDEEARARMAADGLREAGRFRAEAVAQQLYAAYDAARVFAALR